jgi:23S rRNA (adenine2030-N6)-methyltransferase
LELGRKSPLLSYRHSFHAGNFADVLKHVVLVEIIQYLKRKDSAFDYIDTHAGAGCYDLQSSEAAKLEEYQGGIARLDAKDWPELADYLKTIAGFNPGNALHAYPGSPAIAARLLRAQDRASLFELHPAEHALLLQSMAKDHRIKVYLEDGHSGLLRLLPPRSRRAVVLLDPSYEVKAEYQQLVQTLTLAWRRFPSAVYAIWYPVIDRSRTEKFIQSIASSGIKDIQQFELGVRADAEGYGMTAAGMLVINPPWELQQKLSTLLPRLATSLAQDPGAYGSVQQLVAE